MNKVSFYSGDSQINIKKRKNFKSFVFYLFVQERLTFKAISFIFCSDDCVLKLNHDFLNHKYYTDILTFLISSPDEPMEAEIYLSVDRIKENAKTYRVSYQNELLRVMIHGILHLCGYKDKSKVQRKLMRRKENFYIKAFNINFT